VSESLTFDETAQSLGQTKQAPSEDAEQFSKSLNIHFKYFLFRSNHRFKEVVKPE
jgi:hypothetical protein